MIYPCHRALPPLQKPTLCSVIFSSSVTLLKSQGRLNFQHLFNHGSIMLGNVTAKERTKNFRNFHFIKFCAVLFLELEWQIGIRKEKRKKFCCLVRSVGQRKNFESSPGMEHNTFGFCARTLYYYKYNINY